MRLLSVETNFGEGPGGVDEGPGRGVGSKFVCSVLSNCCENGHGGGHLKRVANPKLSWYQQTSVGGGFVRRGFFAGERWFVFLRL